ncbi:RDD family protein [Nonlabens xiamenensis]|uniref:RDD family protein n=1 Tax=Nonlabens xiamenensis TaxID=2341043 RepID=UPI000F609B85|nr:RDD family protein [Nonlabens xiamenensis]
MQYANLPQRVKALVVDQIILIALLYMTSEFLSTMEDVPDYVRLGLFISYFLLYEPIFLSLFKGTVGHMFINIKVTRQNDDQQAIPLHKAAIRTLLKLLLGWVSLLTISGSDRKQAIHDSVAGSVVLEG